VTEPEAGALAWKPLAMATAGAAVLAPDDIAAVVVADGPTMRAAPSVDDVTLFAWTARFLGRVRYRRLAVNAIAAQDREKVTRVLRLLKIVQRGIVHPVPTELDELERACLAVVQIAPPPAEPAAPPPPRPRPAAPAAPPTPPPVRPVWDRAVRPPVANATDPRRTTFTYSAAVSALHGLVLGELELCLPRGATELTTWGRVLRNCLGDFVTAVGTGRSVVVGVRDRGHLIGALEFHPGAHTLIQFVGVRNRSVGDAVATPVIEELERRGLISPQARSARCSP
jgi:hypothetical protein